jgi:hypothetical protein
LRWADTALADTALADTALADTALADTALADTALAPPHMAGSILPGNRPVWIPTAKDLWISVRTERTYPHVRSLGGIASQSRIADC